MFFVERRLRPIKPASCPDSTPIATQVSHDSAREPPHGRNNGDTPSLFKEAEVEERLGSSYELSDRGQLDSTSDQ